MGEAKLMVPMRGTRAANERRHNRNRYGNARAGDHEGLGECRSRRGSHITMHCRSRMAGFDRVDLVGRCAHRFGHAEGSLLLAAVSVNLVIAWLIILAGRVHLIIAWLGDR